MASRLAQAVFTTKTQVAQRLERRTAAEMRRTERLDVDQLNRLQLDRAMSVSQVAFRHTRFYRDLYTSAGVTERDLDDPHTFEHLPSVDKHDVRRAQDEMLSDAARPRNLLASTTGGSTGEPLRVYHDRTTPAAALWWRAYRWWGLTPADNVAHIYRRSRTPLQEIAHRTEWWPTRHILLDARGMNDDSMRHFVGRWRQVRPALLNGYVDGVHEFAQFTLDEKIELPPVTAIAVTASVLLASQREFIESTLGAPVFDCYRSAEVPWVAAQCDQRVGLHVMADVRMLEIVDGDGQSLPAGQEGEIAVTDLWNEVFPLIRYRMGDRSALREEPCGCGRTLPLVDEIQGRMVDVLRAPNGRSITGGFGGLFNKWPVAVRQFQLHQRDDYTVVVRYVEGASEVEADAAVLNVAGQLRSMLGNGIEVLTERVDRIEHVGGKARLVTSDLS